MKNKLIKSGVITAIAASLCCITPFLALIAGTTSITSMFSWIAPFRPFLVGLTILILGIAWYKQIKSQKEIDCECDTEGKPKFKQSKTFLGIVTVFAIGMLAFPFYSGIFYPNTEKQMVVVDKSDIKTIEFHISGMTCTSCEEHINHEVHKLNGIVSSKVSYENGNAVFEFDSTKTNEAEIETAIKATTYKIINKKKN